MRLPPRLRALSLSHPPLISHSPDLLTPYFCSSLSRSLCYSVISPSPISSLPFLLPFLHSRFMLQCPPPTHTHSLYLSLPLPYLPCRCLVSLVPFKARQMERQALSPSSGPNDLFLTMGPNGPQVINDEGSMER